MAKVGDLFLQKQNHEPTATAATELIQQTTMSPIPSLLLLLVIPAVLAADGGKKKLTHIHQYTHETLSGPNAMEGLLVPSPFGANATFGQVAVFDDELRTGRERDSPLVARYQGIIVAMGQALQGHLTVATVVFVGGEHAGSALSVEGSFQGFQGTSERNIVGGSGKFRMARGYYLLKLLGQMSPATSEVDFFVLPCDSAYL
ncbi:pterocarpan synthase 1-like [Triticum aestivum]|nr:pterocarpan synthase 1-like [Triticum aestivum]